MNELPRSKVLTIKKQIGRAKHVLSLVEGSPRRQVTGKACPPERNARDLRRRFLALLETRISPGVYPELAEGVEMTIRFSFAPLRLCARYSDSVAAWTHWGDGLLPGESTKKGKHDPGQDRHIADPKTEGPLDKVSLDPCNFCPDSFDLLVQTVDFFSEGLVDTPEFLPQCQLCPLKILFGRGPPLDAGFDEFEERPGFFLSQFGLQFLVEL